MHSRSRLLAVVLAGGLLLTACGDEDATEEGLVRTLSNLRAADGRGVSDEAAECIAGTLFGRYDEEQIDEIADADSEADFPPGALDAIAEAANDCGVGQGG